MTPQLLIFDLDGTLIDSRPDLRNAVNHVRALHQLPPLSLEEASANIGGGIRNLVKRSLEGAQYDIEAAVAECFDYYESHLYEETILYPGVAEGLMALHGAGHTLAMLSNKPEILCLKILKHFQLLDIFTECVGGRETLPLKPDPGPVEFIMKRTRSDPDQTWMIGDYQVDLEAARRANVNSIYVTYGIGQPGDEKATRVCNAFHEIVTIFVS